MCCIQWWHESREVCQYIFCDILKMVVLAVGLTLASVTAAGAGFATQLLLRTSGTPAVLYMSSKMLKLGSGRIPSPGEWLAVCSALWGMRTFSSWWDVVAEAMLRASFEGHGNGELLMQLNGTSFSISSLTV